MSVIKLSSKTLPAAMNNIAQQVNEIIAGRLCLAAAQILKDIYQDGRAWENDLGNLTDSFAWAVFMNGQEYDRGYYQQETISVRPKKVRGEYKETDDFSGLGITKPSKSEIYGRDAADEFIDEYKPSAGYRFEIVFVAGMYYATFLEEKGLLEGFLNAYSTMKPNIVNLFKGNRKFYYVRGSGR